MSRRWDAEKEAAQTKTLAEKKKKRVEIFKRAEKYVQVSSAARGLLPCPPVSVTFTLTGEASGRSASPRAAGGGPFLARAGSRRACLRGGPRPARRPAPRPPQEYRDKERDLIRLKREAKAQKGFYVEPEAKLAFAIRIRCGPARPRSAVSRSHLSCRRVRIAPRPDAPPTGDMHTWLSGAPPHTRCLAPHSQGYQPDAPQDQEDPAAAAPEADQQRGVR